MFNKLKISFLQYTKNFESSKKAQKTREKNQYN